MINLRTREDSFEIFKNSLYVDFCTMGFETPSTLFPYNCTRCKYIHFDQFEMVCRCLKTRDELSATLIVPDDENCFYSKFIYVEPCDECLMNNYRDTQIDKNEREQMEKEERARELEILEQSKKDYDKLLKDSKEYLNIKDEE